ncbi:MAG: class A beta-lactamase-related serine hydrolase, partial [Candidatus Omnitrophica bacterium]|nr:class A beta-lactamase-related serine hydrolase [Candidatus Omnitrophota bacterium]
KDLETGWEFTLKKDRKFPAASMVKLPLMLAVYDSVHGGAVTLQDELILKGRHKVGGSGRLKALPSGRSFTVEELVSLMISASDNAATNMLIERIDFRPLNRWFDDFGLRDTNLGRMMMDFRFRRKGVENYTSARDVSLVLERLYRGEFIDKEFSGRCLGHLMEQKTKNRIPAFLPEDTPVAHKTGLERGVCHDAGIVYTPQGDFLVCVLTQGAPSHKNAKRFIGRIAATVYDYYVTKTDS